MDARRPVDARRMYYYTNVDLLLLDIPKMLEKEALEKKFKAILPNLQLTIVMDGSYSRLHV